MVSNSDEATEIRPRSQTMPPSILKNSGQKRAPKMAEIVSMLVKFNLHITYDGVKNLNVKWL